MHEEIGLTLLAFNIGGLRGYKIVESCKHLVRVGYVKSLNVRKLKPQAKRNGGNIVNFPRNGQ